MMCKNINKKQRGFSLVELMVVVAIMGTLAAIAIPAYNEYRKSAKKAAYKSDLNALHKGWLAFGVELDSFCERETSPQVASLGSVGMGSLTSSKLYGTRGACEAPTPFNATQMADMCTSGLCTGESSSTGCVAVENDGDGDGTPTPCGCTWNAASGRGPGKHNFIGFGNESCPTLAPVDVVLGSVQILGDQSGTPTTADGDCDLGITQYEMGVYGHFGGADYYGVSINNDGVLSSEFVGTGASTADAGC